MKALSFSTVVTLTAALFAGLGLQLIFFPIGLYWLFALEPNAVADFMARRAGAGFLGLFVMCLIARAAEPGIARRAIATGMLTSMVCFAIAGSFEGLRGFAGPGIWVSVVAELAFAVMYVPHARG